MQGCPTRYEKELHRDSLSRSIASESEESRLQKGINKGQAKEPRRSLYVAPVDACDEQHMFISASEALQSVKSLTVLFLLLRLTVRV